MDDTFQRGSVKEMCSVGEARLGSGTGCPTDGRVRGIGIVFPESPVSVVTGRGSGPECDP